MKLRARLAIATIGAAVPMIAALVWMDGRARHAAAAEVLMDMAQRGLDRPGERERCEADPHEWGGVMGPPRGERRPPGPGGPGGPPPGGFGGPPPGGPPPGRPHHGPGGPGGPVVAPPRRVALDEQFRAPDGDIRVPGEVRAALETRDAVEMPASWWDDDVEVVVRTPWGEGPCAYVYVHGETTRGFIGSLLPSGWIWLLPVGAVMAAVLIAVGPVVRRIRRLTDSVDRSAASGFAGDVPVEGDDEVSELARAFDDAGRAVRAQLAATEDRERALRDFLSNTTHDVMIPLSVLLAHLSTLQQRERDGEPHAPGILTAAMDEAHYLGALVHNLSAAAKLDSAAPRIAKVDVDLNALMMRVIARHRPIAQRLKVEIDHAVPDRVVTVTGDVTLLEQAVSNLVYNAVRHNKAGGHVAAILDERDGGRFRIRVIDDGPGLPAEQLSRMVERGFRGDAARTRSPEGQGIGLDIALRVAELHGLTLTFGASEYGGLQADLEGARG